MTAEDREILVRYGVESIASASDLRRGLNRAGQALRVELATLDTTYQSVYLRELAVTAQRQASVDERALVEVSQELEATRLTLRRLQRERDAILDAGQAPPAGLLGEIMRLEDLESNLRTSQLEKEAVLRQSQAIVSELQSPGSSVAFAQSALSSLSVERSRQMIAAQLLNGIQQRDALESGELAVTAGDELKAMIGFYQTDANGKILRTDDGEGIVSDEFAALGFDATSSLDEVLAGGRNAAQLEGWAKNILSYLKDAERSARTPKAVRAAAAKLESSLIELAAARAFIEKGWNWDSANNRWAVGSDTIAEDARADEDRYAKLQMKLALFAKFEASLKEAMTTAEASQGNVASAALAIIEKPENAYVFRLFDGYNEEGTFDGIYDDTMKGRVLQLSLTVDRLRRQQSDAAIYAMAENYGVYLSNALGEYGSTGGLVAADPDAYLEEMDSLDPTVVRAKVTSVGDTDFEKNIRAALDSLPASAYLYRSHLLSIIEKSPLQGAELKAQLLSAVDGYETDMVASLEALTGESFGSFRMQADLELKAEVDEKVSLFIGRYMNRGQTAKSELATIFDDLAAELATGTLDDKKNVLRVEILDRLKDAVFTSMVRDLLVMIQNGEDFDDLKAAIEAYGAGLVDPTDEQVLTAKESILIRTLRSMLALGDSLDTFEAKLIPEEFREFVMLRQYERAEKRYADYQTLKNSDVESERESAVLDLRGIEADFAASVLLRDFSQWQSTHSIEDYLSQANSTRSIQDYLGEYMQDRHTSGDLLPRGGADIVKLVMQQEYLRLTSAGSANGIGSLDERAFFSDFTGRIYMERVKAYAVQSGFTLTGVVATDEVAYRTIYDAMLADARYAHGGLSFRERLVGDDAVETFFDAAFAFLVQQPSVEMYDPSVIRMLRSDGELGEAITAESVLPDEWTQYRTDHPGYANLENRNYRTVLKEIAAGFGIPGLYQELARIEASEEAARRAGAGYLSLSLTDISDADLDRAITLAGYGDLSGTQSLRDDVKRFLIVQAASQSQASLQDLMRQESLMNFHYGTEAERDALEIFLASEGARASHIEEIFFSKLEKADGRLRELAKNDRGGFFYHLIYAGDTDFVVPGDLSTPFANLKTALFDALTEKEKTSLATHAAAYKKYFAMRSSQELITSGIFEKIDAEIFGNLAGSEMTDAKIAEARRHRSALMVGLMRSVALDNPTASGVAANLPDSVPADLRDDVAQAIARTLQDLEPAFLSTLRKETTLLERFIARYLEADALRNDLADFLKGEADLTDFGSMHAERRALAQEGVAEAQYGLLSHIDADRRALENLATDYSLKQAVAARLASFAALRGANVTQSRFVNYRTYADDGNGFFEADYRKYLANVLEDDRYLDVNFYNVETDPPATDKDGRIVQTYHEFRQGMLLETEGALDSTEGALVASNLPAMFADGSFVNRLVSDRIRSDYDSIVLDQNTTDATDDSLVELRTVQRITFNRDASSAQQMIEAYHAHLANNYLDALSGLSDALRGLSRAASEVDATGSAEDRLKDQLAKAQSGNYASLRTSFETARTAALTLSADSGDESQLEKRGEIDGLEEAVSKAEDQFGASARRKHLKVLGQTLFVEQIFTPIAEKFVNARLAYDALTTEAGVLQDAYSAAISQYTRHLDDMSAWWRRLESAQGDAQRRLAVKDYAETPYLFSASMSEEARLDALKDYATDAREEYRRAGLLLEQANAQLKTAGFNVQIDTNMEKFDRVLGALDNVDPAVSAAVKVPLTDDERKELAELRDLVYRQYNFLSIEEAKAARDSDIDPDDIARLAELENREIYEQYGELIAARADYIKHTMRMIRLQKARTLVQAEIQRLEMETAERKQKFDQSLADNFGDFSTFADEVEREKATNARNVVYQRLAAQYEAGVGNYFGELSAWYWKSGDWLRSIGEQSITQPPRPTGSQLALAEAARNYTSGIPGSDITALAEWLSQKSGAVFASFTGFSSIYFTFFMAVGYRDIKMFERNIVYSIWFPILSSTSGVAAFNPYAYALNQQARINIQKASAEYQLALYAALIAGYNAVQAGTKPTGQIAEVVKQQKAYEESKAKLEYFTKIPDIQTLKERLQKYGKMQKDPDPELAVALYSLTEEDLRYLVELEEDGKITSVDSNGSDQELTEKEKTELYNAKASQEEVEYTDSFNRKYDRDRIVTYLDAGYAGFYRDGGLYRNASLPGEYTRIRIADHDGTVRYAYALLDEDVEDKAVYHAGDILRSLVDHGNILRNDRVQEYLAAGQAQTAGNDWSFILAERDRTMKDLFDEAADKSDAEGGREYAGYTMIYGDYEANQQAVFDLELQQRVNVQKKEWDLREQE
ncbi:hypothetical protein, partial [Leptonema illini]|uniref:hypothetical protein n=1 Tax=Leptonema illini TaxID=183 RepID=UPI001179D23F